MTPDELFEENKALAHHIAGKFGTAVARFARVEFEDMLQWSLMGLWHAAQRFDDSRGVKFSTYAATCCRGYVLSGLDGYRFGGHPNARDPIDYSKVMLCGGGVPAALDAEASECGVAAAEIAEEVALVRAAADSLPGREAEVAHMLLDGKKANDVLARYGFSRQRAYQVINRVGAKLERAVRRAIPDVA